MAQMMGRMGRKHWDELPWGEDSSLGRDERLRDVTATILVEQSRVVSDDLDDLCVLLLFSVFEATVRDRVLVDVQDELPAIRHGALESAVSRMTDGIKNGSFYNNVLVHYKRADATLVEEVNQVRRYRNWVAHGRRGEQPDVVHPRTARDRLQRFLDRV